jgi:hypothetical protein
MKNPFELHKKLLAPLVLAGIMSVFMLGCSSSDDPEENDASSSGGDQGINEMCKDTTDNMDDYEKCIMQNTP